MGHQLRATLRVKTDSSGRDMIYPYKRSEADHSSGVIAYFEIDNRRCVDEQNAECFSNANQVSSRDSPSKLAELMAVFHNRFSASGRGLLGSISPESRAAAVVPDLLGGRCAIGC